jgi:plastocyanin
MWIVGALIALASMPGSTSALEAQTKPKPAKVFSIVIDKATFGDAPASVAVGDTIEWTNLDIFDHTTTSKTGGWDAVIPAGKKARVVMKKAGSFAYLCKYHPNMTGTIKVRRP